MEDDRLASTHSTVFIESEDLHGQRTEIEGYDFNQGVNYPRLVSSMVSTGFQASNLGDAIQIVNQMLDWSLADEAIDEDCNEEERDLKYRKSVKCKVFLGFTSNLVSSGIRDTIRYLVEHHMVDVVVSTAGGIEEDLVKCLAPTYRGDFSLPGALLRSKGLNRIGNLLVPNDNYCKFEDWIIPIFDQMLKDQTEQAWILFKFNGWLTGRHVVLSFFPQPRPDHRLSARAMNDEAVHASPRKTGMIILGGGMPKHHISNANMFRNGADYAVFINTAQEFDGSDSGARPDEAVSWGKIRDSAKTVKVHCDATIAFPLLVAETFAKNAVQTTT
ncbi:hypothetical protein C1H46_033287 [Malus baccata]|uniref:Deoxyhypusine synthase n=1 Tax=Malus baccata TaxID=106549 RepID=A0A540L3W7_MALBA|nr:hypothetical protein C1H46_033287 [Malus baccata]